MRVACAELLLPLFEVVKGSEDCLGMEGHYCQEEVSGFLKLVYHFILKDHHYFCSIYGIYLNIIKSRDFFEVGGDVVD